MKIIADLHIHSKYSRATSPSLDFENITKWAKIKGIDLLITGDFTHPLWMKEIKEKLKFENGIYNYNGIKFIIGGEVSNIYEDGGKIRKVHSVIMFETIAHAEQFNDIIRKYGDLKKDGRPILKLSLVEMMDYLDGFLFPAHIWTPWFGVLGSKSGYDSLKEAFGRYEEKIVAIETGLSSDPKMNWIVLDKTLISNSDAHSPEKLGREANVFDLKEITYKEVIKAIKTKDLIKTYEFYPQEGKYYYDGHRKCNFSTKPSKSKICPICRKSMTIGVLHRVIDLAKKPYGYAPKDAIPFDYIIPLKTMLSKIFKKGEKSKFVEDMYSKLIRYFGSEFNVYEQYGSMKTYFPELYPYFKQLKENKIFWKPGYDGVFGEFEFKEIKKEKKQKSLFDF